MNASFPLIALCVLLMCACTPKGIRYNDSRFQDITFVADTSKTYIIGKDDVLNVTVFEKWPDPSDFGTKKETVKDDGTIFVPPIGKITVEGWSIREVEQKIVDGLKTYVKKPVCEVEVVEFNSQKVCVLGNLNRSQVIGIKPGDRLVSIITRAGGNADQSYLGPVKLVRRGRDGVRVYDVDMKRIIIEGHLEENVQLFDGDILFAQERPFTEAKRFLDMLTFWVPAYFVTRTLAGDISSAGQ
jgi:polysaccharide biosynthesis/export protein